MQPWSKGARLNLELSAEFDNSILHGPGFHVWQMGEGGAYGILWCGSKRRLNPSNVCHNQILCTDTLGDNCEDGRRILSFSGGTMVLSRWCQTTICPRKTTAFMGSGHIRDQLCVLQAAELGEGLPEWAIGAQIFVSWISNAYHRAARFGIFFAEIWSCFCLAFFFLCVQWHIFSCDFFLFYLLYEKKQEIHLLIFIYIIQLHIFSLYFLPFDSFHVPPLSTLPKLIVSFL